MVPAAARQRAERSDKRARRLHQASILAGVFTAIVVGIVVWVLAASQDRSPNVGNRAAGPTEQQPLSSPIMSTRTGKDSGPEASCEPSPPLGEFVENESLQSYYDTVFLGRVDEIRSPTRAGVGSEGLYVRDTYFPVVIIVEDVLVGQADTQAIVMVPVNSSETVEFNLDTRYAVVAHANEDATFSTSLCTLSKELGG